jgi:hypothetical protein
LAAEAFTYAAAAAVADRDPYQVIAPFRFRAADVLLSHLEVVL